MPGAPTSLSPLPFILVIVFVLVWQALYYLLSQIGAPKPIEADTHQALMVWANEGGADEPAA